MAGDSILFYALSFLIIYFALGVLMNPNPIKAAFNLVLAMVGVAGVFFHLQSGFLGGVQLAVYAGAVMVLFVMVLMIFDLKKERDAFSQGFLGNIGKLLAAGIVVSLVINNVILSSDLQLATSNAAKAESGRDTTKILADLIFTEYVFAFEVLGILLLLVAIGAVSISRIKGGTHADS
ncbi:MAG: NADH-quinone oxidoreductase subunit J [Bdellovibrionaceae bacterium]|nr:NADH-quinone oxidoreductase subunit J [Pseudobdellovibrionaceae bacterium]|tara:strand:+ start:155014 stop:155547 length:534 start_codon:yes stop_codon:yes gene_type:complete